MPFHLTSDQELIRKTVRELVEAFRGQAAMRIDHDRAWPAEALRSVAGLGLAGLVVPAEKGGAGTDTVSFVVALEEAARASGTVALALNNLNALGTYPVALAAGDALRAEVLPGALSGERYIAWCLTEPGSGSDLAAVATRAERDGENYRISGLKSFVVGAPHASELIVFARVPDVAGLTAFLVPADARGVKVAPAERTMTFRGSDMAQVFFDRVEVPAARRLGAEGEGLALASDCLALARLGGAAIAVGLMQAAFEESVEYSGQREQFRTPIKRFQAIQWIVADMDVAIRAARLLTYAAADRRDRGEDWLADVAAAKLHAAEAAKHITQKAIRVHGGAGFMREVPVERFNRDARAMAVYAGTSELQRAELAARALSL